MYLFTGNQIINLAKVCSIWYEHSFTTDLWLLNVEADKGNYLLQVECQSKEKALDLFNKFKELLKPVTIEGLHFEPKEFNINEFISQQTLS